MRDDNIILMPHMLSIVSNPEYSYNLCTIMSTPTETTALVMVMHAEAYKLDEL